MKVAVLSGICVKNDAISQAVLCDMRRLERDLDMDVRLFTSLCGFPEANHRVVRSCYDLITDPWFVDSDLVIAHFGISYELFNVLPMIRRSSKVICVFHNITPAHLVPDIAPVIEQSFEQLCNMAWADLVICVSPTNLAVLRAQGIQTPAQVVPLEVPLGDPVLGKPSRGGKRPKVLYVGRLVEAKGVLDLLEAVGGLLGDQRYLEFDLTFAGNLELSDPSVIRATELALETLNGMYGDRFFGALEGNVSNERRDQLLSEADIFVLPSYHEGFGVPVIEAYGAGCRVIGYDNSNLPSVLANRGRLVPTGDIRSLHAAILAELELVKTDTWTQGGGYDAFNADARTYASHFAPDRVSEEFKRAVVGVVGER